MSVVKLRTFWVLIALFVSANAHAADECLYNAASIKPAAIDKSLVRYSTWDVRTNELRSILVDGNLLYVKYWACEHYGLSAQLIMPSFEGTADKLANRIKWLSKLLLDNKDAALVNAALDKHSEIRPGDKIEIEGTTYDLFKVEIDSANNSTIITIEYFG